jgi:acyl-CoA thioester hydrolase
MKNPQLPPTMNLVEDHALHASTEKWFEYPVTVHPHHTDYAGVVWHGGYLRWLEEARVEYLHSLGIDYAQLVKLGCDLPVVDLSVRYHRALRLGDRALVKTRMLEMKGVRMNWAYQIKKLADSELCVSAFVSLVAVDRDNGKVMRRLPPNVEDVFSKLIRT